MGKNNKNASPTTGFKHLLPLLAAAVVTLLGISAALYYSQNAEQQARQTRQAEHLAGSLAQFSQDHLDRTVAQLELLAQRSDINRALAQGPRSTLSRYQQQWLADSRIDLIADRGGDTQNYSYTAREQIKKARQGDTTKPLIIAGKPPRLVLTQASSNGNGVLLLRQSLAPLTRSLRQQLPDDATVSVRHEGSNLVQIGNPGDHAAQINRGPWHVKLALPRVASSPFLVIAIGLSVGLAVLLACTLLSNRLLGRALRQDAAEMIRYCTELRKSASAPAGTPFQFPVFQDVINAQQKLAERLRQAGPASSTSQAVSVPAEAMIVEDDDSAMLVDDDQGESLPDSLFRAYDIRGIANQELTSQGVYLLGRAIGTQAGEAGQQSVIVGRDGRLSSDKLSRSLVKGLLESGRDVINLGQVPSPVVYYATEVLESRSGVCLTASHNPAQYNGLKVVIDGHALYGEQIQALQQCIAQNAFSEGQGKEEERDINERYLNEIINDIVLARPMKIAIDCGNAVAGELAPQLFSQLGCEVVPLFTEVDGNFPNHPPDPSKPANLAELIRTVKDEELDLGLAFDGDADRLAMVTNSGEIIWADRLLMLFARDLLSRTPGADVLFDVKCSRALPAIIRKSGGRPMMYKTGHSLIKAKMKESGTPLAGEMSGHFYFADRWYGFDDGLYAAARLLEVLSLQDDNADAVFAELKTGLTTPEIHIAVDEHRKTELIDGLIDRAEQFSGGRPTTIDGLRIDFPDGWGLVRASNTTPVLVARFEGRDKSALERVQSQFRDQLNAVDSSLDVPF